MLCVCCCSACLRFGVWCFVFDDLMFGVYCFGVRCLVLGVCCSLCVVCCSLYCVGRHSLVVCGCLLFVV